MNTIIDRATIDDLDAVEKLYNEVCDYLADKEYNPGWRKGCFPTRENALCFIETDAMYVARIDEEIVGSISLTCNPSAEVDQQSENAETGQKDTIYIHIFTVHPKYHRYGIGSQLLEFALQHGKKEYAKSLRLYVWENNSVAIKTYEKNGYVCIGKEDIGLGEFGMDWFCLYEKEIADKRLKRDFFMTDALALSKKLLGKVLVHETPLGTVRGIITETEAYMGVEDKGSHTYQGKRTERTEPMFHIGGTSYVYLIYGMYSCVNVTAGDADVPMAALIRMVEPYDEESREIMERLRVQDMQARRARRGKKAETSADAKQETDAKQDTPAKQDTNAKAVAEITNPTNSTNATPKVPASIKKHLADGPGKLCIAMNITKADNDIDLVTNDKFYLTEGIAVEEERIQTGKRIGIDYAEEAADYLWRFTLT